jgi:hypothetical protein
MKAMVVVYLGILSLAGFVSPWHALTGNALLNNSKRIQEEKINNFFRADAVRSGDVVFRLGHGFISESMRKLSLKDPRYSHAGIISIENGLPIVYHLLGGEASASVIKKEQLKNFCSAGEAKSFAVYRASLSDAQKKSVDSLNKFYFRIQLPYDNRFDLTTDSAMYCTEYVYKVLSKATKENILISSSILSERTYIACDNIYLNPAMHKVFSFDYE